MKSRLTPILADNFPDTIETWMDVNFRVASTFTPFMFSSIPLWFLFQDRRRPSEYYMAVCDIHGMLEDQDFIR